MHNVDTKKKDYMCWLHYKKASTSYLDVQLHNCANIITVLLYDSLVGQTAVTELILGLEKIVGNKPSVKNHMQDKASIVVGLFGALGEIDNYFSDAEIDSVNDEGFIIKPIIKNGTRSIIISGKTDKGILYGVFTFLAKINTETVFNEILDSPQNAFRMLNHWDNIDGSVERGYAGKSIFFENNKITKNKERIKDYARLLASVGINSIAINNVNVHTIETKLITKEFLPEVAIIADIFRSYGIKLFLSINFASPIEIGNLDTADPLDPQVAAWWKDRSKEIYSYIPDFGGFLVKADSEFRPGPFTYNRTHADGANMLAQSLRDLGGLVIWRCFVYNCLQDWRDKKTDRARAAYDNFKPLDGLFDDNVILQIKNGPMDFQVREPVSPLFGGLSKTNHFIELQITQEYTGQQKHLCYLVPMWKEIFDFDTYAKGKDSTIKKIVSGSLFGTSHGGVAAVANIGNDLNWTGLQLAQANLYGFGRLAWNPSESTRSITEDWVKMTFGLDERLVQTISTMLENSWQIYENYTTPLGIGWMINPGHHFGPNIDGYEYDKWGTYHRADLKGMGVDRSLATGTGYTRQYHDNVFEQYEDKESCPEELVLFFHRVLYTDTLSSGKTLIQYIYDSHFEGVEQAKALLESWRSIETLIEKEIFEHIEKKLQGQIEYAIEWRDVVNTYFYRKSGISDNLNRTIY